MFNLLLASTAASDAASEAATNPSILTNILGLLPWIAIFVVMYFLMIRPQQKAQKEEQKMRSNIQVGDEVLTIGGILGIVVSLKDDTLVIETGSDRSKIRIVRSAVQTNITAKEGISSESSKPKAVEEKPL